MASGVCTPTADRKQREVLHGWCPFPLLFHLGVQLVGIGVYHPEPDLSVNPEPADLTTRLSQLAPWTPRLCLPDTGTTGGHHAHLTLYIGTQGTQTLVLTLG